MRAGTLAMRMRIEALDISYLAGLVPNGAQGWNRTSDTAIFSRMLYQLSYLGIRRAGRRPGGTARFIEVRFGSVQRRFEQSVETSCDAFLTGPNR